MVGPQGARDSSITDTTGTTGGNAGATPADTSINSPASASINTTAGFSVITYTGNGTNGILYGDI